MDVSSNLTSAYVNTIDDMEFFQGDTVTIPFKFLDSDGDVIDLTGGDIMKWYLCPSVGIVPSVIGDLLRPKYHVAIGDISMPPRISWLI